VTIIRTAKENWEAIQKGAECLSSWMKTVSPYEIDEVLEAVIERVEKTRFYSTEELESIAEKQLEKLVQRMKDINIEDKVIDTIIKNLNWHKEYAIKIASEQPIWENSLSNYLPIVPVIDEKIIDIDTQMKLLENDGKIGKNLVPIKKIKNYCKSKKSATGSSM
jgi:Glu-tRNA(Gln) amidotransferase subunit E-like FAD-binding protein